MVLALTTTMTPSTETIRRSTTRRRAAAEPQGAIGLTTSRPCVRELTSRHRFKEPPIQWPRGLGITNLVVFGSNKITHPGVKEGSKYCQLSCYWFKESSTQQP